MGRRNIHHPETTSSARRNQPQEAAAAKLGIVGDKKLVAAKSEQCHIKTFTRGPLVIGTDGWRELTYLLTLGASPHNTKNVSCPAEGRRTKDSKEYVSSVYGEALGGDTATRVE